MRFFSLLSFCYQIGSFRSDEPVITGFFVGVKSFPLDKSYYMGLYFLYFHSHNIRKFVNILPAIFGR